MPQEPTSAPESDQPTTDPEVSLGPDESARFEALRLLGLPTCHPSAVARLGWVYFLAAPQVKRIKIGTTRNHPSKRLKKIRDSAPVTILPVGVLRGSPFVEDRLHSIFDHTRWRYEWFDSDKWLARFIADLAQPWAAADDRSNYAELPLAEAAGIVRASLAKIESWTDDQHHAFRSRVRHVDRRGAGFVRQKHLDPKPTMKPVDVLKAYKCLESSDAFWYLP